MSVLVCAEDLPAVDDLCERNRLVALPLLDGLRTFHENHEIVILPLVVDLGVWGVAAHVGGW